MLGVGEGRVSGWGGGGVLDGKGGLSEKEVVLGV